MATRGLNDLPVLQILPAPGGRRLTESELDFNDPLVLAVEQGLRDEVYTLLAAGVGVHHIDARRKPFFPEWNGEMVRGGPTLLMLAMRRGHDDVAELLIESSADPTLSDHFGKAAVMMAMEFGRGDIRRQAAPQCQPTRPTRAGYVGALRGSLRCRLGHRGCHGAHEFPTETAADPASVCG